MSHSCLTPQNASSPCRHLLNYLKKELSGEGCSFSWAQDTKVPVFYVLQKIIFFSVSNSPTKKKKKKAMPLRGGIQENINFLKSLTFFSKRRQILDFKIVADIIHDHTDIGFYNKLPTHYRDFRIRIACGLWFLFSSIH